MFFWWYCEVNCDCGVVYVECCRIYEGCVEVLFGVKDDFGMFLNFLCVFEVGLLGWWLFLMYVCFNDVWWMGLVRNFWCLMWKCCCYENVLGEIFFWVNLRYNFVIDIFNVVVFWLLWDIWSGFNRVVLSIIFWSKFLIICVLIVVFCSVFF